MKYCTLILSLVLASFVHAKTILISDIDDTLKNSHVLNTEDKIRRFAFTNDQFLGMNWVYNQLAVSNPEMKFFYVSTAPQQLMQDFHEDFIRGNNFARGKIYLRTNIFSGDFKLQKIRQILKQEAPTKLILVGDNAENDTVYYDRIRAEFPGIEVTTYIHQAYSAKSSDETGKPLLAGQIGFVTSLDFVLHLHHQNLISQGYLPGFFSTFAGIFLQQKRSDVRLAIADWMDCRDFAWTVNDSVFSADTSFAEVKQRIVDRCSQRPFAND